MNNEQVKPRLPEVACDSVTATVRAFAEGGRLVQKKRYWWWKDGLLQAVSPELDVEV